MTAREIWGKKKRSILWCFEDLEGVFCGGQCPFCFGLYLGKVRLNSSSKSSNSRIIKSYAGVAEYRATQDQRSRIMSKLPSDNYVKMKRNIGNIFATDPTQRPGTNFASLIKYLESPNMDWVKKINRVITK